MSWVRGEIGGQLRDGQDSVVPLTCREEQRFLEEAQAIDCGVGVGKT